MMFARRQVPESDRAGYLGKQGDQGLFLPSSAIVLAANVPRQYAF
jgi:hypothetical protein